MNFGWKEAISSVYGLAVESKNFMFDRGLTNPVQLSVPVLSVGNLSVGGTGKTPVVQKILSITQERSLSAAVVARNYRARSRGIHRVDWQKPDGASYYGDEAFLISKNFPEVPVWTGPRKYLTAEQAVKKSPAEIRLVIIDDGFQHRALHRDFDLVLLDASSPAREDRLLPWGNLREGFGSLRRASAVALTKVNWSSPERIAQLKSHIPSGVEVVEMEFHSRPQRAVLPEERVLLLSGIAKPGIFRTNLEKTCRVMEHLIFKDHHDYQSLDSKEILRRMRELECSQILTTEKDFVKLQVFDELKDFLNPILMTAEFRTEPRGLYAFLDQSFLT